ncbi:MULTISPECIES: response regulator [unclassified Sphingomonas]|uniref:response regulator n=1 Tax=unclassified Sphingomonas TaxID=196159 RepID=UPI00161BC52E|nr:MULTISPECIES: response regulator [unclassified Sphingomonas]MBB3348628.1 DNA-binding response OmpR family regulator [Sphingomonas sp. BK069]MBB3474813.1 DNA-binding response OmpR family regulator [Sphingomonas sp. BK345]
MAEKAAFILLVEDDPDISAIAVMALHLDPGFTVTAMRTGADALQHLERSPKPDLILADNNLPDMEGVALVKAIKAAMSEAPPIAFFTASVRSSDIARYTDAGAIGTIAKPFDPIGLAAQARALLSSTFS